jgi:hypothetical protein
MAKYEIPFNRYIDLKYGSIPSLESIGSLNVLVELVKNQKNSVYLTTRKNGIILKVIYDPSVPSDLREIESSGI